MPNEREPDADFQNRESDDAMNLAMTWMKGLAADAAKHKEREHENEHAD